MITKYNLINNVERSVFNYLKQAIVLYENEGYTKQLKLLKSYPDDFSEIYIPCIVYSGILNELSNNTSDISNSIIELSYLSYIHIYAGSFEDINSHRKNEQELEVIRSIIFYLLKDVYIPVFDYTVNPIEPSEIAVEITNILSETNKNSNAEIRLLRYYGNITFNNNILINNTI